MQMKPARATAAALILGYLYLPRQVELRIAVVPNLNFSSMTCFASMLGVVVLGKGALKGTRLGGGAVFFALVLILVDVVRTFANSDAIPLARGEVPPIASQTVITFVLTTVLTVLWPYYLGVAIGSRPSWLKTFIQVWLGAAVIYSVLALIEIRMSPQINIWTYGYFQHSFAQMVREGGYRPIVYMTHGLELSLFLSATVMLAAAISFTDLRAWKIRAATWTWYFVVVSVLSKSLGALVYMVLGLLWIKVLGSRSRARMAAGLGVLILMYPLARIFHLVPLEEIIAYVDSYNPDRAGSLAFRFRNEEAFLQKVSERLWTGWGGFARTQVFDPNTGESVSVIDGAWIAALLDGGIPSFFGFFGLLVWPVLRLPGKIARYPRSSVAVQLSASMVVIGAFYLLDMIPNGGYDAFSIIFAGIAAGLATTLGDPQWSEQFPGKLSR